MRFTRLFSLALVAAAPAMALAQDSTATGPTAAPGKPGTVLLTPAEMLTLAKTKVAINKIADSIDKELAKPSNKKDQSAKDLRASMVTLTKAALAKNNVDQATYDRLTFTIGVDSATRRVFDSTWVAFTGVEIPYRSLLAAAALRGGGGRGGGGGAAPVVIPPGPAATHLGHVLNSYPAAPNAAGLLPTAEQDAATAIQHAGLGIAQPTNLEYMKTHAGHVLHALDPSQVPTLMAPGTGYGVKKAATDAATHTDMGAKMPGASANVILHAGHIQSALLATAKRVDDAVAIAKQVQTATTAADAFKLMQQLQVITGQLMTGVDANGDGKIDLGAPEGGLALARQHATLLIAGESNGAIRR